MSRFLGADDWWLLAAVIFAAGDEAMKIMWVQNGLGQHVADVPLSELAVFAKVSLSHTRGRFY